MFDPVWGAFWSILGCTRLPKWALLGPSDAEQDGTHRNEKICMASGREAHFRGSRRAQQRQQMRQKCMVDHLSFKHNFERRFSPHVGHFWPPVGEPKRPQSVKNACMFLCIILDHLLSQNGSQNEVLFRGPGGALVHFNGPRGPQGCPIQGFAQFRLLLWLIRASFWFILGNSFVTFWYSKRCFV